MSGEVIVVLASTVLAPLATWIGCKYVLGFGPCAGPPSEQKKIAEQIKTGRA